MLINFTSYSYNYEWISYYTKYVVCKVYFSLYWLCCHKLNIVITSRKTRIYFSSLAAFYTCYIHFFFFIKLIKNKYLEWFIWNKIVLLVFQIGWWLNHSAEKSWEKKDAPEVFGNVTADDCQVIYLVNNAQVYLINSKLLFIEGATYIFLCVLQFNNEVIYIKYIY